MKFLKQPFVITPRVEHSLLIGICLAKLAVFELSVLNFVVTHHKVRLL